MITFVTTRQAIDEMVQRIVARFDPEKVILFGSQARGDAGPDSDVDILVVMPVKDDERREKRSNIRAALDDISVPKDVFVISPWELEIHGRIPGTLGRAARLDGKVLYERAH